MKKKFILTVMLTAMTLVSVGGFATSVRAYDDIETLCCTRSFSGGGVSRMYSTLRTVGNGTFTLYNNHYENVAPSGYKIYTKPIEVYKKTSKTWYVTGWSQKEKTNKTPTSYVQMQNVHHLP